MKKAVAWLEDTQRADGSFTDTGKAKGIANSNSTGLAGWALGEAGASKAAAQGGGLGAQPPGRRRQPVRRQAAPRTPGAIAYDDDAYGTAQGFGIKKKTSDQWRRASAQALPVLRWAPRAEGDFTRPPRAPSRRASSCRIG